MNSYSRTQLSDGTLLRQLKESFSKDRSNTAALLADIAEVEVRKLYLPEGYSSMFDYCVETFGLSEQAALKRIRVARKARQYPGIFAAIADGRLNLTGALVLTPYLTDTNADELLVAASRKKNWEIEKLVAERFPRPDVPTRLRAIPVSNALGFDAPHEQVSVRTLGLSSTVRADSRILRSPDASAQPPSREPGQAPMTTAPPKPLPALNRPKVTPLAPQRFALQVTIGQEAHDDLRRAQALLSHQIPSGDIAQILARALRALVGQLEKQRCGATTRTRTPQCQPTNPRTIPAQVKRAIWNRDAGQCTFVGPTGHRCSARAFLEFDHAQEVSRGGPSTIANLRLRCRAHNQYSAERSFGAQFMNGKRREAQERRSLTPRLRPSSNRAGAARRSAAGVRRSPPVR